MSHRIHLSKATITDVEEKYLLRALRSGWVAPLGPDADAFEKEIAQRVGVSHALAVSSGTAALHLGLLHLGARPGTVVVLPTLTFAASANAIIYTGAEPVFVDSSDYDGNINPELLIQAVDTLLKEGYDVAAVMAVDLFGRTCDYNVIEPALTHRGIPLVEDAAEALGATLASQSAGSFGEVAALSFNGNKIITTSGGGMLLSNNEEAITHARYVSTQARQPAPWYEHTEVGYNYRMSNILAALGRAQLTRLDSLIRRRRQIRELYREHFRDVPSIRFLGHDRPRQDSEDNAWLTVITLDKPYQRAATRLIYGLNQLDIEARHVWKPMHMQPLFRNHRAFLSGAAEKLFRTGVALPSGADLTNIDIHRVTESIRAVLRSSEHTA